LNAKPTQPATYAEASSASASTGTDPLVAKIKAVESRAIERSRQRRGQATQESLPLSPEAFSAPLPPAKVVKLPIWPEGSRGTPNSFLRSALFAAIQGKERRYLKGEVLASQLGITVRFTGMQLDQFDLDVWEQAMQLAAKHPLGNVCVFKIKAFLRALGRQDGKSQRDCLMDSFRRLMSSGVEIGQGPYTYGGGMLEFWHDKESDTYRIQQNPRIIALYHAGWTAIDWEQRRKLRRKPLALWLHGWLSSHAENYPTKVEIIRELCGSRDKTLFGFRRQLRKALADLQAQCVVTSWAIDSKTDLMTVERTPSGSQQRHLIRKNMKARSSQNSCC